MGEHSLTGHSPANLLLFLLLTALKIVFILFSQIPPMSTNLSVYTKRCLQTQVLSLNPVKASHLGSCRNWCNADFCPPLQLRINSFQVGEREAFPPGLVHLLPLPRTGFKQLESVFKECLHFSCISVSDWKKKIHWVWVKTKVVV